jgi:alpha-galactosidase
VDQFYIDSNEWAVCDDPTHDHGEGDGEWAQVHGLYRVVEEVRRRFPDLVVENCAGGSQRGDFGMAQYCDWIAVNDIHVPSSINRQYGHGLGCIYPGSGIKQSFKPYGLDGGPQGGESVSPERLEWRALCRLLGHVVVGHWELGETRPEHLAVLERLARTHRRIRRALDGDRYVLGAQPLIYMPDKGEPDQWEAYQFVAREGDLAAVLVYRPLSPEPDFQVVLRGLEPGAFYEVEYHSGRPGGDRSGAQLMDEGIRCQLERPRSAEVIIITRREGRRAGQECGAPGGEDSSVGPGAGTA